MTTMIIMNEFHITKSLVSKKRLYQYGLHIERILYNRMTIDHNMENIIPIPIYI